MSHTTVLSTNNSVHTENVAVAESGEDSDDEWNYIQVNKEKPEEERQTPVELKIEGENITKPAAGAEEVEEEAIITSPTPPTASLGEAELTNQESHAIAQAFAEPEEVCTEILDDKQETDQQQLFDLEHAERSSSVAAEHDSDLGNEEDLEEMDSQLNPDAKEFVPVSPQRTSVGSPFGNGLHNRFDLMDDEVVAQSPRKGNAVPMDDNDIELPAENDFTEISQRPSELVDNELNANDILTENGAVDEAKLVPRPESSGSQCSYQEMNLKEAMHGDEKQELAAEVQDSDVLFHAGGDGIVPTTNGGQQFLNEQDPMNMSFYKDENNPFNPQEPQEIDMNAVQMLPDDDDDLSTENDVGDFVAQPVHLSNQQQNYGELDELGKEFASESEKLNQNKEFDDQVQQHLEQGPITNYVQELANEVTKILNEVTEQSNAPAFDDVQEPIASATEIETHAQPQSQIIEDEITNKYDLSIHANEFVPSAPVADSEVESIQTFEAAQPDPYIQTESQELLHIDQPLIVHEEPRIDTSLLQTESIPAEQKESVEASVELASQPEPVIEENSISAPIVAAAAVATVTAAVAGAVVGVAKAAPLKKTTDAKKTDVKSKVSPIKKTSTTTTTSKVAAKPSTTATSKTAAPKVASRTVAPKVGTTVEKKTTTSTLTARKPLSNGTGATSTVTKKTSTTTSTVTKSSTIGSARSVGTASKPTTARTSGTTSTATKTTVSKPAGTSTTAAPRVPLSARTASKPATGTSTASRVSATKTTTSTTSSTATSRVKSAPATSTVRSTTLTKPKTSTTTGVAKSAALKLSPTKTSTLTATKSPATKTSLGASSTIKSTTPTRKPLTTATKTTAVSKSPKVPTTNGVASKTKVVAKSVTSTKEKVTTNGDSKANGHIENGTGAEKIIDLSAD